MSARDRLALPSVWIGHVFRQHRRDDIALKFFRLADLIVDSDGTVVACCNDFEREMPVGNLKVNTLIELLTDPRRLEMMRMLEEGRHDQISTCARCRADIRLPADEPAMP